MNVGGVIGGGAYKVPEKIRPGRCGASPGKGLKKPLLQEKSKVASLNSRPKETLGKKIERAVSIL